MTDLVLWLVCLLVGHVYTEWAPATWVQWTMSGAESYESDTTTNMPEEVRFCLRCHNGYQQRWAR